MRSEECGTLIWPFEQLDAVCQIGNDVDVGKPMIIIGVGRKANETEQTVVVTRIDSSDDLEGGHLKIETISDNS